MEELRSKHKTLQSAAHHIALECIHPQHAFQSTQHSPKMFHPKGLKPHLDPRAYGTPNDSPILGRALCLTPRGSPVPGRVSHLNEKFQDSLTLTSDTDALVAKISAMFPTVSETHIKILLKKYYNREAVVISALQVEKHPITTPGPLTMSPSAVRLQKGAPGLHSALQLAKGMSGSIPGSSHFTPLTGTPHGSPSLLRPASGASSYYGARSIDGQPARHQSPKMKLKYLKSIFPKAEETLILDVLANKDNNVQKASEELIGMGFSKKETIVTTQKKEPTPQPQKKVVTIMKTFAEKCELKEKLQKKYTGIAERVIALALESVDYHEERAEQILNAVLQDEAAPKTAKVEVKETLRPATAEPKKGPILKTSSSVDAKFKSQYCSPTKGPNPSLRQGPKDSLLLEDYIPWTGPDPDLRSGQGVKPEGPETRERPFSLARGPSGLAKGAAGLAKGSLYQKLNKKSAKIIG
uniref:SFRICE_022188 n=1 Tax=Spodoptera frugiperda TaxID=7108 RepID=A0A2H1X334_SPOFR